MIAWTITAARDSGLFDHVIVSTDDPEIRDVAVQWGAECPFTRPAELAGHHAITSDVVAHATRWALDSGWALDAVCCIYATAPFVEAGDLARGLDIFREGHWEFAIAAAEFTAPVFRAFSQRSDGGLQMFFPEYFLTRSQDLPRALHDAGQFYWGRPNAWLEGLHMFGEYTVPVLMPKWRVQDIDDVGDWRRAELMFTQLRQESGEQLA